MAKARKLPPPYKRKPRRSLPTRLFLWLVKIVVALVAISILWVFAYKFVNPPITVNMLVDILSGRGATHEWMPITKLDHDMVDAAIAGEDGKFCSHHGFDFQAIENAMKNNASGGRIRGGSTISQQTAKNVFLWNGGGYIRKGAEAWFTFLIEHIWGKRRIMEVYLNVAETGIGTYGVNAGSIRYFGHDASAMTASEAARIAAILPLPKERGAIAPKGFTRRYGNIILGREPGIAAGGYDSCIYKGYTPPQKKAPPPVTKAPRPLPGAEYETAKPQPSQALTPPAATPAPANAIEPERQPAVNGSTPANAFTNT